MRAGGLVGDLVLGAELYEVHAVGEEAAGVGDVDGCLDLVPRQHPHLDPRVPQRRNAVGYLEVEGNPLI